MSKLGQNKSLIKIILWVILVFGLLLVAGLLINMFYGLKTSEAGQSERMEALRAYYASDAFQPVNEQDFCDFNLAEELEKGIRYDEVQYIATHNSYKEELTFFSKTVFNLFGGFFGMSERQFEYSMPTLTEQLNSGIRFFELDLIYMFRSGGWKTVCCHDPILDNKSHAFIFELALEEFFLWSENNPGHLPVTIFIEPKQDHLFLPGMKPLGLEGIRELEQMAVERLGEKLLTPGEMLGDSNNFKEMRETAGWPELKTMTDKFLFVLFPHYNSKYTELDETMRSQAFFMSKWYHAYDEAAPDFNPNVPFIMTNEPDTLYSGNNAIEYFLERNFFVRTRLDFFPEIDPARKELSMKLGTQLLTTDYPKGNTNADDYYAAFEGGYMMSKK